MKEKNKAVPLTESTYLILLSLLTPLHGYGVMQKIRRLSNNRVQMGPGTLYGGLTALKDKKLIRRVNKDGDLETRKKMYEITPAGRNILERENRRMEELLKISHPVMQEKQK